MEHVETEFFRMSNHTMEDKILDAALDVVGENTIGKTKMQLIADRADMVQSNVHYYFRTKRQLLIALLERIQETFTRRRDVFVEEKAGGPKEKLSGFFEQKKEIILKEPKYDRAQIDYWSLGQSDPEFNRIFTRSYDEWREHIILVIKI